MNRSFRPMLKAAIGPVLVAAVVAGFIASPSPSAAIVTAPQPKDKPWSFGILGDTQWTVTDDGYNPNTAAANIIKQVDHQFIDANVKFVIAVGDTVDKGSKISIDTRALYAQDLYNAGIGFYPLRGNHEAAEDPNYLSGPEFRYTFPQIGTGVNNNTPAAITTAIITTTDLANNPPASKKNNKTFIAGANFSEPASVNNANNSVSYSFKYGNATFMLLDQFDVNGNYYNSTIPAQMTWISSTLSARSANTHAFVFTHKNLLGGNHKDNMFGGQVTTADPGDGYGITTTLNITDQNTLMAKQTAENAFVATMQINKVDYLITGHDHHHYASIVTSPDGQTKVHQLIVQSASSKFYTSVLPVSAKDAPIQQDLGKVGYYIVTVDGPRVTIDYYADSNGGSDYGLNGATFDFRKISSIVYSLNGAEKVVAQGGAYAMSDNTTVAATLESGFKGTTASILAGTNASVITTNYAKKMVNDITTAWTPADRDLASDIFTIAGMSRSLGSAKTDEYVLSLSYIPNTSRLASILKGKFTLVTRDGKDKWVNAISKDFTVNQKFVLGAWNSSYKLGTYGVDTATNTAWAVLNYNGDFAVAEIK